MDLGWDLCPEFPFGPCRLIIFCSHPLEDQYLPISSRGTGPEENHLASSKELHMNYFPWVGLVYPIFLLFQKPR